MRNMKTGMLIAALGGMMAGSGMPPAAIKKVFSAGTPRRERKPFPSMLTSTPEEIAQRNSAVTTRQVVRRINRPWIAAAQMRDLLRASRN